MYKMINQPTSFYLIRFVKKIGILVWTCWICSCIGKHGGAPIVELDVPVKPLPYSVAVLPFEYPHRSKGKTFKRFHLDTLIGQELQRQNFFKDVFFPSTSSSNLKLPSAKLNDLTLRGKVTAFRASCTPQTQETEAEETSPQQEETQDQRSQWLEEQNARELSYGKEHSLQGWEWGRNRFQEADTSTNGREDSVSQEKSSPFSFEMVKNKVRGKLIFTIKIFGRQTNKIIFKKTYMGELDEIVTAFTATPETVADYVSNVLLGRLLKNFLEDLAIDFYQYTQSEEFIRKTNLPRPSAMAGSN
jgi:hypothetical protein